MDTGIYLEAAQELLRQKYQSSLYLTCKDLLEYREVNPYTHSKMIKILESSGTRKLIVMPRGTFKSSIGVVGYSIWRLMRNPDERILLDSEVYTNSKNFLREIKDRLMQPRFTELFGDWSTNNWNESEITISKRTRPLKEASVTAGGIETVKVGQHYDTIIFDDLNSNNNSQTTEGRQKVVSHYQLSLSILEPTGTCLVIGTRYAENDVIGHILKNEVGVTAEELLR